MDITGGIGVAGTSALPLSDEEHEGLSSAVRESIRRSVVDLLRANGPIATAELRACPTCGDRVILLEQPTSFVYDPERGARICKACGAERDLIRMLRPEADIGGEGG